MAEDREQVYTYVPTHQKKAWVDHAEKLDMSQSEFVRTMVQAGRRGFDPDGRSESAEEADISGRRSNNAAINSPNGPKAAEGHSGSLEARVREVLSTSEHLSWDELIEGLTDALEDRLESTLQELQAGGEVRHSGRHGGYTLVEE